MEVHEVLQRDTVVSVDLAPPPRNFDFFYPFLLIFAALERSRSPSEELWRLFFIETPWCPLGDPKVDQNKTNDIFLPMKNREKNGFYVQKLPLKAKN